MPKRTEAYKAAGVDTEAAGEFISRIKSMVAKTFTKGVVTDIGGFGGLFKPDLHNLENPVLVAGTDGVGTKLKLAFQFDRHDTIGIDLVAMNVNDLICCGAKPLFFLDYFAAGKLDVDVADQVVQGIIRGCREADVCQNNLFNPRCCRKKMNVLARSCGPACTGVLPESCPKTCRIFAQFCAAPCGRCPWGGRESMQEVLAREEAVGKSRHSLILASGPVPGNPSLGVPGPGAVAM
jgi:hypothetical protein